MIGRGGEGDQVGGGIEMCLFRHIFVRGLHIEVMQVRHAAESERHGVGESEGRDEGQRLLLRAVVGAHPRCTAFYRQTRQNLPFGFGIDAAEERIGGAILENGVSARHHRDDFRGGRVEDVVVDPLHIAVDRGREARTREAERRNPLRAHFRPQAGIAACEESARMLHAVAVQLVDVRRAPGRSHIGQYVESRQDVGVRTEGVGDIVIMVEFPVGAAVKIDAARVEALMVEASTGFCAPFVAGILLNGEDPGILLHIVGDDRHHARARRVGVLDIGIEQAGFRRPVVGIRLLPAAVGLKTLQLQVEGGHVRAEVAALVELAAVVVLIGGLPFQRAARGKGVARVEFSHLVHHFLVGVVDVACPRVDFRRAADANAFAQQLFVAHLRTEQYADAGGEEAVIGIGFKAVAFPTESHRTVGFAQAGVVEQIACRGTVAAVDVRALHAPRRTAARQGQTCVGRSGQGEASAVAAVECRDVALGLRTHIGEGFAVELDHPAEGFRTVAHGLCAFHHIDAAGGVGVEFGRVIHAPLLSLLAHAVVHDE